MKGFFFLAMYLSISVLTFGQSEPQEEGKPQIPILARAQEKQILLRWAPSTPVAWQLLNKYGYQLERYTVTRDGNVLEMPERLILATAEELKPQPMHLWETLVDENDYAAIAAQAIYGETFELDADNGDIMQVVNKVRETESRFSYTLFAADQSFEVAKMSGLAFVDVTARENEKYLYRIHSQVPETVERIDFGFVYAGLQDYQPLPKPYGLEAVFTDRAVVLKWERANFDHLYNSYWVEKSSDLGKTYSKITNRPLINTSENENNRYMFKTDSLAENGKTYYYRVRGVSSFGEVSMPSDSVVGMGVKKIDFVPAITGTKIIDNEKVRVNWDFPLEGQDQIDGFKLEKSNNTDGPYQLVNTLSANIKETIDERPYSTNYYRVKAYNKTGDETTSFSVLVQLQDSIPPAVPVQLSGLVDSIGVVKVSWKENSENDLLGYRVYRSNFKNSEFGQVTNEPVKEAYFTDSISLNTLTGSIFYKVVAVDFRFNPSDFSEAVALKRPDIIPPVPPVFKSIKSVDQGIAIEWINSSSADVAAHVIYKNKTGDQAWNVYQTILTDTVKHIIDSEVEAGVYYNYTIIAIDSAKLESLPAKMVTGVKVDTGIRAKIENIKTSVDRTNKTISIQWEYAAKNIKEFLIYKKSEEEPLSLYTSLTGDQRAFVDASLVINNSYLYRIKAIYEDGAESPFSKELRVKY